ncbi:arylsulfatase [Niabella insulamsoli]|uniref:arylsulfatase B n=1 Tax=Niabella insulamsoli TaxID=3144874 RepID=UPI0031FD4100
MRYFILSVGIVLSTMMTTIVAAQSKPNIIVIVADDLGWGDVGFHKSEIRTPHLDQFAKEGVILNRYYVSPICSPTRAGLMTGRYPERFGLRDNVIAPWLDFGIDTSERFLPQYLAEAGYKNRAAIGKWHLGHSARKYLPLSRGFTHFYGHYNGAIDYFTHKREGELDWHNDWNTSYDKGYSTDLISNEAVKCIQAYKKEGPFFLYVAYNAPHGPLQAKKEDLLKYGFDPSKPLFGEGGKGPKEKGRGNTKRQTYSAMVTSMDEGIGRILDALKSAGLDENTLVLFHSDNGAEPNAGGSSGELKGEKFQEWDGGVRSSAVVRWPKGFKGGWKSEQLCGYIDIVPTLCAIAGAPSNTGKKLDGINIVNALTNQQTISRELFLGHGGLIVDDWKLVKANSGNEKMKNKTDVVYHITADPEEKTDVRQKYPDRYQQLLQKLRPYEAIQSSVQVPPYGQGRQTFKAPPAWNIKK